MLARFRGLSNAACKLLLAKDMIPWASAKELERITGFDREQIGKLEAEIGDFDLSKETGKTLKVTVKTAEGKEVAREFKIVRKICRNGLDCQYCGGMFEGLPHQVYCTEDSKREAHAKLMAERRADQARSEGRPIRKPGRPRKEPV